MLKISLKNTTLASSGGNENLSVSIKVDIFT
jgi:hypothetical protein